LHLGERWAFDGPCGASGVNRTPARPRHESGYRALPLPMSAGFTSLPTRDLGFSVSEIGALLDLAAKCHGSFRPDCPIVDHLVER